MVLQISCITKFSYGSILCSIEYEGAHLYGSRDLRLDYVEKPKIEPNEVLIRVGYAGSAIVIKIYMGCYVR